MSYGSPGGIDFLPSPFSGGGYRIGQSTRFSDDANDREDLKYSMASDLVSARGSAIAAKRAAQYQKKLMESQEPSTFEKILGGAGGIIGGIASFF
jgi:hypothetical protein